jgi:hypothetical protein
MNLAAFISLHQMPLAYIARHKANQQHMLQQPPARLKLPWATSALRFSNLNKFVRCAEY